MFQFIDNVYKLLYARNRYVQTYLITFQQTLQRKSSISLQNNSDYFGPIGR